MADPILVVGYGMLTPVGLSVPEAAASTRARTARMTEISWRDRRFKPFVLGVVPDGGLAELAGALQSGPLSGRESRMLRLADPALHQALAALPPAVSPVPLFLGLPELYATLPLDPKAFLARLASQSGAHVAWDASTAFPLGRSAGLVALAAAMQKLAGGDLQLALVGGVDSYLDLHLLGTLDMQSRLRTERNSDGFTPGEGAGFLLLATADAARKHKLPVRGRLIGAATAEEPGHIYSNEDYLGEGLAQAFETTIGAAGDDLPLGCVYASLNGERYWAKEFGVAMLRQKDQFLDPHQVEHPAECFGDLGAAHGPVMLGLALAGIQAGYRRGPAIVYCSSDYATRASVIAAAN